MRKTGFLAAIVMISLARVAAGSGLPSEVADRLQNAISFDESNDFAGTYRITISSVVQKPNGKSREENLIEADVTRRRNPTKPPEVHRRRHRCHGEKKDQI